MQVKAHKECSADGCSSPSRSRGYCTRHYKQLLRHERLTPELEQRNGCRIHDCDQPHKARGYCSRHYKELRSHGHISNNGRIKESLCSISDCKEKPKAKGLCDEHHKHYSRLYIDNGYTWGQVDKIIIRHNQHLLFMRNRLQLIRERHRILKDRIEAENQARILTDIMGDDDIEDDFLMSEDGLFDETLWPEASYNEGGDLW